MNEKKIVMMFQIVDQQKKIPNDANGRSFEFIENFKRKKWQQRKSYNKQNKCIFLSLTHAALEIFSDKKNPHQIAAFKEMIKNQKMACNQNQNGNT